MNEKKQIKRVNTVGIYCLRVLGILCIVYGFALLASGAGSGMVPIWLIFGALCLGLSIKKYFQLFFYMKWFKILVVAGVVIVAVLEGLIIANGFTREPEVPSDYIIVLGAKVNGEAPSLTLQYRLETAYHYLAAHQSTKAILSGGQGVNEGISEAEAMHRYLVGKGIAEDRLLLENQSTNTYENLRNSFALLGDHKNLNLSIVTSDFHVFRAKLIALKLGRPISGIGSKNYFPLIPNYYLRELIGVFKALIT